MIPITETTTDSRSILPPPYDVLDNERSVSRYTITLNHHFLDMGVDSHTKKAKKRVINPIF